MRELLASWIAALLPRRVVAHAFARVLADVRRDGAFYDPKGVEIAKVSFELTDKWGRSRVQIYKSGMSFSLPTPGGR